jgi:hypothetical protein
VLPTQCSIAVQIWSLYVNLGKLNLKGLFKLTPDNNVMAMIQARSVNNPKFPLARETGTTGKNAGSKRFSAHYFAGCTH